MFSLMQKELQNYAETHDLYKGNQEKAIYTGNEELYTDEINFENRDTVEFARMVNNINDGDMVKISKLSVLGPNINNIVEKCKILYNKNVKLYIYNIGNIMDCSIDSSFKEISNMTGISERTLYHANQKFDEQ